MAEGDSLRDEGNGKNSTGEAGFSRTKIRLQSYDSEWPTMFARLQSQIRGCLGATALIVEHAGSTSVPGLSAKPIIDVVLAVPDSSDEAAYVPKLERAGYKFVLREPDWFEHRLMNSPEIEGNIHVFTNGCEEIDRMLAFRDWLRTNEEDRRLYERTKQELALRSWTSVQSYADAKSDVVRNSLARALGNPRFSGN